MLATKIIIPVNNSLTLELNKFSNGTNIQSPKGITNNKTY